MKVERQNIIDVIFLFVPLLFLWFIRSELILLITFGVLLIMTFSIKYHENEHILLALGIFAGIVAELGGDYFNKVQFWENGSFLGIPMWLPLIWGYGIIYFRRIGNWIVREKK